MLSINESLHVHLADQVILPFPLVMIKISLMTPDTINVIEEAPIKITLKLHGTE